MTAPAIRIDNITHEFDSKSGPVRALDRLSLEVPAGIVFGLLGPNGAGKTTTIRLLLGLLEPTEGRVEVLGFDTQNCADEIRTRTGALLEHTGVYEHLSAEDNLEFYARAWRLPATERRVRIQELLTHMGLWERRKDQAGKWSRGMKQKLALARALLHRPALVLLDEPTAGLDVAAAVAVRQDMASLAAREGVTILLTTHNMAEAQELCSQVAVIRQGQLVTVGHPDDLRARSGTPRVEIVGRGFSPEVLDLLRKRPDVTGAKARNGALILDVRPGTEAAPLVSLLVNAGASIEEVHKDRASLQEVFLTLTQEEGA